MKVVLSLAIEIIAVFAVVGFIATMGLVFRNPFRPEWLKRGIADSTAAVLMAAALSITAGHLIAGLLNAGLHPIAAILLPIVLFVGFALVLGRLLRIGERLRRADAGQSPFARLRSADEQHGTGQEPGELGEPSHG